MSVPVPATRDERPALMVSGLRDFALRGLARMYRPDVGLFAFRIRRRGDTEGLEGTSVRYTAISLIGLAGEDEHVQKTVLAGGRIEDASARLVRKVASLDSVGDVALILWLASLVGSRSRSLILDRLRALRPDDAAHPTVEIAWALTALCLASDPEALTLRTRLADRLMASFEARAAMFPHRLGGSAGALRNHVSCFADLVYPIQALARYADAVDDGNARDIAVRCAREICARQGADGQWWWHYDRRTGEVVERYPVYAVHQDAMAPMALFALERATGIGWDEPIARGLAWLAHAPELQGRSLIDRSAGLIWRKVARREPRKLTRYVQAAVSRVHSRLRAPGLNALFPACVIDDEDRPYHLGWLLHAWPAERATRWDGRAF